MNTIRKASLAFQLTVKQLERVRHDAWSAPIAIALNTAVPMSQQKSVARIATAVAATHDMVDAEKSKLTLVE
jgi:hypothetical protein